MMAGACAIWASCAATPKPAFTGPTNKLFFGGGRHH
jgi:hypothetical protein